METKTQINLETNRDYLIGWFQQNAINLVQEMKRTSHHYEFDRNGDYSINPYHVEGEIWTHTMMVCKMAEVFSPNNNYVKWSTMLHDTGKPASREIVHIMNSEDDKLSDNEFIEKYKEFIEEFEEFQQL